MEQVWKLLRNAWISLRQRGILGLLHSLEMVTKNYRSFLCSCPLCGARFNRLVKKCDKHALLACPYCQLIYVAPLPTQLELDEIYSKPSYYEETIWGGGMTPHTYEEAMLGREWFLNEIKFVQYEKRLGANKRMLEIGSFDGSHLLLFKRRGWEVEGVEIIISIANKAIAKGIPTYTRKLEDLRLPACRYDLITMNHTLEHIHNPGTVLNEVWRILKPSGKLILQVPEEQPLYQEGGQHLLFFTAGSMDRLLTLMGFKVLSIIKKQHHNMNTDTEWIELNAYAEKRAA